MPIHSNADYIPVMDQFIAHWGVVDPVQTFSLPEGVDAIGLAEFQGLRVDLDGIKSGLESRLNTLEISRVTLNQAREAAADRLAEFNRRLRAEFPDHPKINKLPAVPTRTAGRDPFLTAMDDAKDLWSRVNALPPSATFTAPLLLQGGATLAAFTTQRTALDAAFTARGSAEGNLSVSRVSRDLLQARVLRLMKQYRLMVEARFAADSTFVETLPQLTPAPGSTPDAVEMQATWLPAQTKAEITWEASTDPELADYQLRAISGPDYNADDVTTLHTFSPADARGYLTGAGFAIPGATMTYKIYVRLTTGNEAGSQAVSVTRPG